jgi:hypothetical protein
MKAGPNDGVVDTNTGGNYFYFWGGPGETKIRASYKSSNAANQSSLRVEVYDEKRTWVTRRVISSSKESSDVTMTGNLKEKTKVIVAVLPPGGGVYLITTGGGYEVEVTGAVKFDPPQSAVEAIVGIYNPKVIYENENTAVKFSPDGALQFASGTRGSWKVFDADQRIYTIVFASTRLSLKLTGLGLVEIDNPSTVVFQRTH